MLGVRILEPATREEYEAAFGPTTAMVCVNSSNRNGVEFDTLTSISRERGVPVLVDAAAERPTVPNDYLRRGATPRVLGVASTLVLGVRCQIEPMHHSTRKPHGPRKTSAAVDLSSAWRSG
jgi:hypothetical protein